MGDDKIEKYQQLGSTSIDNSHPRCAIREVSAFLPQHELVRIAEQFHTAEDVRKEIQQRINAYFTVLTSNPDKMGDNLIKASKMGINFADTSLYPLSDSNVAIFRNERELLEYTSEMVSELIAGKINKIQEQVDRDGTDASGLIKELSLIAQARIGGARPDEILTSEKLRMLLATELAGREVFRQINQARTDVRVVIEELDKSSQGVPEINSEPLMQSQERISELCRKLAISLNEVDIMTSVVSKGGRVLQVAGGEYSDETIKMIRKAKEIFKPFIDGSHLITIRQLRDLETYLKETGQHSENIAHILKEGIRTIKLAKETGYTDAVKEIENQFATEKMIPEFEQIVQTLDHDLSDRAIVIAYAGNQNRMVLRSVPAGMMARAERESGIPPGYISDTLSNPKDDGLVIPPSTPPPSLKKPPR